MKNTTPPAKGKRNLGDISLKSELKIKKTILCGLIFSKIVFALSNIFSNNTACKSGKYVINKKLITHGLVNSNMLLNFLYEIDIYANIELFIYEYVKTTHTRRSLALTLCPHSGQSERWGLARRGKKYEKKCNNPNKKWHEKARKMKYKTNNVETT